MACCSTRSKGPLPGGPTNSDSSGSVLDRVKEFAWSRSRGSNVSSGDSNGSFAETEDPRQRQRSSAPVSSHTISSNSHVNDVEWGDDWLAHKLTRWQSSRRPSREQQTKDGMGGGGEGFRNGSRGGRIRAANEPSVSYSPSNSIYSRSVSSSDSKGHSGSGTATNGTAAATLGSRSGSSKLTNLSTRVQANGSSHGSRFASTPITTNGKLRSDAPNVALTTSPTAAAAGNITFRGAEQKVERRQALLRAQAALKSSPRVITAEDEPELPEVVPQPGEPWWATQIRNEQLQRDHRLRDRERRVRLVVSLAQEEQRRRVIESRRFEIEEEEERRRRRALARQVLMEETARRIKEVALARDKEQLERVRRRRWAIRAIEEEEVRRITARLMLKQVQQGRAVDPQGLYRRRMAENALKARNLALIVTGAAQTLQSRKLHRSNPHTRRVSMLVALESLSAVSLQPRRDSGAAEREAERQRATFFNEWGGDVSADESGNGARSFPASRAHIMSVVDAAVETPRDENGNLIPRPYSLPFARHPRAFKGTSSTSDICDDEEAQARRLAAAEQLVAAALATLDSGTADVLVNAPGLDTRADAAEEQRQTDAAAGHNWSELPTHNLVNGSADIADGPPSPTPASGGHYGRDSGGNVGKSVDDAAVEALLLECGFDIGLRSTSDRDRTCVGGVGGDGGPSSSLSKVSPSVMDVD